MVANDSIKLYMLWRQYQKDIKNQSLFSKDSEYFCRKQFPVSEHVRSEVDIYVMEKAKVLPGPQVFAIRTFVFENFFDESEMFDPICSQPLTSEQVDKELSETRKEVEEKVDEEIEKLEEEVLQKLKKKRIARISDEDEEVDDVNKSKEKNSEKDVTDSGEEKMAFDETYDRKK